MGGSERSETGRAGARRPDLEPAPLERPVDCLTGLLLPPRARLPVRERHVHIDHVGVEERERAPIDGGLEHEGRIAAVAPRGEHRKPGDVVFHTVMPRECRREVRLGDTFVCDADDAVVIPEKGGLRCLDEDRSSKVEVATAHGKISEHPRLLRPEGEGCHNHSEHGCPNDNQLSHLALRAPHRSVHVETQRDYRLGQAMHHRDRTSRPPRHPDSVLVGIL